MPKKKERYYSENDQVGVTRAQLKRLRKAKQVEYLVFWFGTYYEDPVHRTSHDSSEGGYLWNHGGPYDAADELSNEFDGIVSEKVIAEAVEEVQADGTYEWAGSDNHPDEVADREEREAEERYEEEYPLERRLESITRRLEGGARARFGDDGDLQRRREILSELERLAEAVHPPAAPGMGHNNPPPDIEEPPPETSVASEGEIIRAELQKPEPNALEVALAVSRLHRIGQWFMKRVDIAADSYAKVIGVGLAGVTTAKAADVPVGEIIHGVVQKAVDWLSHVTILF